MSGEHVGVLLAAATCSHRKSGEREAVWRMPLIAISCQGNCLLHRLMELCVITVVLDQARPIWCGLLINIVLMLLQ